MKRYLIQEYGDDGEPGRCRTLARNEVLPALKRLRCRAEVWEEAPSVEAMRSVGGVEVRDNSDDGKLWYDVFFTP